MVPGNHSSATEEKEELKREVESLTREVKELREENATIQAEMQQRMKERTDAFHEAALLTGNCLCNTTQANISEAADFQAELMVSQEASESQGAQERTEKFGQEATRLTEQLGLEKESNQANSARLRQAEETANKLTQELEDAYLECGCQEIELQQAVAEILDYRVAVEELEELLMDALTGKARLRSCCQASK